MADSRTDRLVTWLVDQLCKEQIGGWFNYLLDSMPSLAPTPGVTSNVFTHFHWYHFTHILIFYERHVHELIVTIFNIELRRLSFSSCSVCSFHVSCFCPSPPVPVYVTHCLKGRASACLSCKVFLQQVSDQIHRPPTYLINGSLQKNGYGCEKIGNQVRQESHSTEGSLL